MKKRIVSLILCLALLLSVTSVIALPTFAASKLEVRQTNIKADSVFNADGYGSTQVSAEYEEDESVKKYPKAALVTKTGDYLFPYKETWLRYYYDDASDIVSLVSKEGYRYVYYRNEVLDKPSYYKTDGSMAFSSDYRKTTPMKDGYAFVLEDMTPQQQQQATEYEIWGKPFENAYLINAAGQKVYQFDELFGLEMGGMGDFYWGYTSYANTVAWPGEGLIGYGHGMDLQIGEPIGYVVDGYKDMTGKTVFTLNGLCNMGDFSEGLAAVQKADNKSWGYIDKTGKEVIGCQFDSASEFIDGVAAVSKNGKYGYIDKTGKVIVPLTYDAAYGGGAGLFSVGIGGKYGLVDENNNVVLPLEYDDISSVEKGVCYAVKNQKLVIITVAGKACAHTWGAGKVTKAATEKATGIKTYTCTKCGAKKTETLAKLQNPAKVFGDIKTKDWYYKAVNYAYNNGLFGGISATKFAPNDNMTRGMFVTVLGRLSGVTVNHKKATKFVDVKKGQWYTGYVNWASDAGIVGGVSPKYFAPDANVTREQICKMMVEYCKYAKITLKNINSPVTFADASKISAWAKTYVSKCQTAGLVGGSVRGGKTYFDPQGKATRAQVAQILFNFTKNYL